MDETVLSAGAKRRQLSQRRVACWPGFGESIYYIHPELRIGSCRFGLGKGAGPL